jgi:zinc transport system substrate-binding protein
MEFDRKLAEQIAQEIGANIVTINPLAYLWDEQMKKIADALTGDNGKTD